MFIESYPPDLQCFTAWYMTTDNTTSTKIEPQTINTILMTMLVSLFSWLLLLLVVVLVVVGGAMEVMLKEW